MMGKKIVHSEVKVWKETREIKEIRTLNVSGHGRGLYLYLPKDLCEIYGIIAGDRVKARLDSLFKRDWAAEEKGEEPRKRGDHEDEL